MIKKATVLCTSLLLVMQQVNANIPEKVKNPSLEKIVALDNYTLSEHHSKAAFSCYLEQDYDRGIDEINKAIKLEPSNQNYIVLGLLYLAKKDIDNALESFIKANYEDYFDMYTVRTMLRLKSLLGLTDDEFNRKVDKIFLETEY